MPKATYPQVQAVCRLLHSRGREVTSGEVRRWLTNLRNVAVHRGRSGIDEQRVLSDVLAGDDKATSALHQYFGNPLEDEDKAGTLEEEQE